eukprot:gene16873-23135_t
MIASTNGYSEIVDLLLSRGANIQDLPNYDNTNSLTPSQIPINDESMDENKIQNKNVQSKDYKSTTGADSKNNNNDDNNIDPIIGTSSVTDSSNNNDDNNNIDPIIGTSSVTDSSSNYDA